MPLFDLLSDKSVQPRAVAFRYGKSIHLFTSRRQLVEHRNGKIAENDQRIGSRDRGRRHDENMRVRALAMQRAPLRNAEAVLFVRDRQRQIIKRNIFREQRVRTDDNVAAPPGKRGLYRAFLPGFHRTGQKKHVYAERREELLQSFPMLLCQNLRRRHESALVTGLLHRP